MATKRKGVSRSRITTSWSSKANELPEFISTVVTQETATSSPERKSIAAASSQFNDDVFEDDGCGWSTPKAKRFRIPEIESCPPAPKKQRAYTNGSDCSDDGVKCSLRRSSIPFFKPPHEQLAEFFFGSVSPFPYVSTV